MLRGKRRHAVRHLVFLLGIGLIGLSALHGQETSTYETPPPAANYAPIYEVSRIQSPAYELEAESLPAELAEEVRVFKPTPKLGPTPVSDVGFLMNDLGLKSLFGDSGIQTFGWIETGYSAASSGTGTLTVQPRQNRFGNELNFKQLGLVLLKPLKQDEFDLGFNIRYFNGADAAIGQPKGGIGDASNTRFTQDFRDLNLSAHLPIITAGGMDVKVGRMNTIIGYNGFLAPYRPFYSSDYQFANSQDGAFTGLLTHLRVTNQLEVWNGLTLGANTFFTMRSENSICYIGQINYFLTDEKRTKLTGSTYIGPNALNAAPGLAGDFTSMVEVRLQHSWNRYFTQVLQNNMGWDANSPVGTGAWYGLYTIGILHLNTEVDTLLRAEWFDDVQGTRTGVAATYSEVTLGINWHPNKYLEIRPEIRSDFASKAAFGTLGNYDHNTQLTGGVSALVKF